MFDDLDDLYQDLILDHNRSPRNFRRLDAPTHHAHGHNPLCGDSILLHLKIEDGCIADVAFSGDGCAISKASASMMTEALMNKSVAESAALFSAFHQLITGRDDGDVALLGKLATFKGVREFPVRVKCATLCWQTLNAALTNSAAKISTE